MEDEDSSGEGSREDPRNVPENSCSDEDPDQKCDRKAKTPQGNPSEQNNFLMKIIVGSVISFVAISILIIYADVLAKQRSKPLPHVQPCPPEWIGFQGLCYYFSKEKRNWTSSQNFCLSQKASLLTFNPDLEKDFVMHNKGKAPFWIGLRREKNQPWKWTTGENSALEIIGEGQCVYLNNEAALVSLRCRTELFWICSKAEAKLH